MGPPRIDPPPLDDEQTGSSSDDPESDSEAMSESEIKKCKEMRRQRQVEAALRRYRWRLLRLGLALANLGSTLREERRHQIHMQYETDAQTVAANEVQVSASIRLGSSRSVLPRLGRG